jgi:hypothetical protein
MIYAVYESISGYVFSSMDIFSRPFNQVLIHLFWSYGKHYHENGIMMNGHKELSEEELDLD